MSRCCFARAFASSAAPSRAENATPFVGGEAGWQPTQHKYVRSAAGLVHSNECGHAIRSVKAPTAAELDANLKLYGGA